MNLRLTLIKNILIFLTLVIFNFQLKAQESKNDTTYAIDKECKACLDTSKSTISIFKCENMSRASWDKEVDKYYKLLLSRISPNARGKLKTAQQEWKDYHEDEMKFSDQLYGDKNGADFQIVNSKRLTEIIRQRAIELKKYYDNYVE